MGVHVTNLQVHPDSRGSLTEWFRADWLPENAPRQWNIVRSHGNVLRGVHVHFRHSDALFLAAGRMMLGLCDIRPGFHALGAREMIELRGDRPTLVHIPVGVAHGFHFTEDSTLIYGLDEYFDTEDDLGCRWDDPALALPFSAADPILSERDRMAGSFARMVEDFTSAVASRQAAR